MKTKEKYEQGQKLLWDNGYDYSIVEYFSTSVFDDSCRCIDSTGEMIFIEYNELEEYSKEQENYLNLKYK